jgi:beta-phosphoglucomutase
MLKAVIFDFDGVLMHTDEYHVRSWKAVADQRRLPFDQDCYNSHMRGLGRMDAIVGLATRFGRVLTEEECEQIANDKNEQFLGLIAECPLPMADGVVALTESIKQHGLRVAVGSSSRNSRFLLRQAGSFDMFDVVVDGNDAPGKPDPAIFLRAAQLLKIEPCECIVIEDAEAGIQAALEAQMAVVAVGPIDRFRARVPTIEALTSITVRWLTECYSCCHT